MSDISQAAKAAREAARKLDGEFGSQAHSDPGEVTVGQEMVDPRIGTTVTVRLRRGDVVSTADAVVISTNGPYSDWGTVQAGELQMPAKIGGRQVYVDPAGNVYGKDAESQDRLERRPAPGTGFPTQPGRERFADAINLDPEGSQTLVGAAHDAWLHAVDGSIEEQGLLWTWVQRQRRAALTPAVAPVDADSFESIPAWDGTGEPPARVAEVFMLSQQLDGRPMPGCLFFATDQDDGIVNGYFWAPPRTEHTMGASSLTSESGSFYTEQLVARAGRLVDYEPGSMSFSDAMYSMPDDRLQAYRRVMGVSWIADECGAGRW